MTGAELKALPGWGRQNGLLSEAELNLLMATVRGPVLEVGHYAGLSTRALWEVLGPGMLTTIDAHCRDGWVLDSAQVECKAGLPGVEVIHARSQDALTPSTPWRWTTLFYDGDHAEEQRRVMELAEPHCEWIIMDDRDFPVPRQVCDWLRSRGWQDLSPPLVRGTQDKMSPETQTLGIFRRSPMDGPELTRVSAVLLPDGWRQIVEGTLTHHDSGWWSWQEHPQQVTVWTQQVLALRIKPEVRR